MKSRITLILVILILILMGFKACSAPLDQRFLDAIHQVESGGRYSNPNEMPIIGDHGKARGPFQIHYEYWADSDIASTYDKYPQNWERCDRYFYAIRVVTEYLNKYALKAIERHDYETLARVHHSGPKPRDQKELAVWLKDSDAYWARVKKELDKQAKGK